MAYIVSVRARYCQILRFKARSNHWADGLILSPVLDRILRDLCHQSLAARKRRQPIDRSQFGWPKVRQPHRSRNRPARCRRHSGRLDTRGKAQREYMCSELPQLADIARSTFNQITLPGSEQFHARLWLNNATRLSGMEWLWSAKRA